ncbi:MAG: ribonuclease Z [Cytophagaceae bacterium]
MSTFEVKILGSSSATPVYNRHHSSQLITIGGDIFLFDCGEATQYQLYKFKFKYNKISYIFISHLHGDHYLGLVGLLSSMHLNGRNKELKIFGPRGLDEIITIQLKYSETFLSFPISFTCIDTTSNNIILDLENLTVETIPLTHRIACSGFLIKEKPKKHRLNKLKLPENLSLLQMASLKRGEDVLDEDGNVLYYNQDLTFPPKKSRSYAYCSDTAYEESILPIVQGTDLLYHEATFLSDMKVRAKETFHSTAEEAAIIATKANVGRLIIGHFSARYKQIEPLLEEAKNIFPETYLAEEGSTFSINEE